MVETKILIDVVAAGTAIIIARGLDRQARVGRDGNRFYVEDADTEQHLGYARSYRDAGRVAARAWGITDYTIELDKE
ncbi:hypothetical protein [Amycolatopsis sp.]|uniref:hypothetical protein n=1 Tax=Amycolatopsis sp. TaxID=37632 RepID=UPI002C269B72|nr:hypothetical protein [Amycolatopsis sp.]HVV11591.1 hypothetical protein [Amycolatopsis sp.]